MAHKPSTINLQCGAPKIAKLVYNFNNYGLWYLQLKLMGFINQLITGGLHIVAFGDCAYDLLMAILGMVSLLGLPHKNLQHDGKSHKYGGFDGNIIDFFWVFPCLAVCMFDTGGCISHDLTIDFGNDILGKSSPNGF